MNATLVAVDTSGIQGYIFGSNRLQENLGASYLVHQATDAWPLEELQQARTNIVRHDQGTLDEGRCLEAGDLEAEVVYAGGGNVVLLFSSESAARDFARRLSRRVLKKAPGLELVIASSPPFPWDPAGQDLAERTKTLFEETLARKKHSRLATPMPLLGLGVTAKCSATGMPATMVERHNEVGREEVPLVSSEVAAKLRAAGPATGRLQDMVRQRVPDVDHLAFTDKMDELGRTHGRESYVAVVHADANALGSRMRELGKKASTNREYVRLLRTFSQTVDQVGQEALAETLRLLNKHIEPEQDRDGKKAWCFREDAPSGADRPRRGFQLAQEGGKPLWPVRPLVFGGDDVTFVCDGQLGLTTAVTYLQRFHELSKQHEQALGGPLHACAGVCIVKAHYPFHRAYRVSEELARGAKSALGDARGTASALDWHFSTTGLSGALDVIRDREYQVPTGYLLMRPLHLTGDLGGGFAGETWRTWDNFRDILQAFSYGEDWAERRNKLKDLREALRDGPEAVETFRTGFRIVELPPVACAPVETRTTGWAGRRTPYFDALEMADHALMLSWEDVK